MFSQIPAKKRLIIKGVLSKKDYPFFYLSIILSLFFTIIFTYLVYIFFDFYCSKYIWSFIIPFAYCLIIKIKDIRFTPNWELKAENDILKMNGENNANISNQK